MRGKNFKKLINIDDNAKLKDYLKKNSKDEYEYLIGYEKYYKKKMRTKVKTIKQKQEYLYKFMSYHSKDEKIILSNSIKAEIDYLKYTTQLFTTSSISMSVIVFTFLGLLTVNFMEAKVLNMFNLFYTTWFAMFLTLAIVNIRAFLKIKVMNKYLSFLD